MKGYFITVQEPATGSQWQFAIEAGRTIIGRFAGKKVNAMEVAMVGGLPLVEDRSEQVHQNGQKINLPASQRTVSGTHGHFILDDTGLSYLDTSTNGTRLNGRRIGDDLVRLEQGDRLEVGPYVVLTGARETAPARSAAPVQVTGQFATVATA